MKEEVFQYLLQIPKGKVVTYKQIAISLGNAKYARIVGNILHGNENPDKYPCYKVVNSKGCLAKNFAYGGIDGQKRRLLQDGIDVAYNRVDLKIYQYHPE